MNPRRIPSKEELKKHCKLSSDNFSIKTSRTNPTAGFDDVLEQVSSYCGIPTFINRYFGRVTAIILVGFFLPSTLKNGSETMADNTMVVIDRIADVEAAVTHMLDWKKSGLTFSEMPAPSGRNLPRPFPYPITLSAGTSTWTNIVAVTASTVRVPLSDGTSGERV